MRNEKSARKEAMKRLLTTKRLLPLGLALLLLVALLGAAFLLIPRPTTRWSYQPRLYSLSQFPPIVSNNLVCSLFGEIGVFNYMLSALDAHTGQVRWSSFIRGLITAAPVMADGLVYVVATDAQDQSTLHALDAASGREQWSYQQTLFFAPTIANGMVYLHSINGRLYAFDARSGAQRWSVLVGNGASNVVVANHLVYIAAQHEAKPGSTLFALEVSSGYISWSVEVSARTIDQLAVADGEVYLATSDGDAQVWALDALSGRTIWSVQLANPSLSLLRVASFLQVVNGIAYLIYSNPTTLYALDTRTGQVVWSVPTDSQLPTIANGLVYVYSGTTYYRDGALICGASCPTSAADITDETGNGTLSALDARSGIQWWSHPAVPFKGWLTIAPETAIEGGIAYVWTTKQGQDTLYALNAGSGSELWSYQTGGNFSTLPAVVQGMVYICLDKNSHETVEAIQPPGGPPGFSW